MSVVKELTATGQEIVVVLQEPKTLTGTVTNAETGEALKNFTIEMKAKRVDGGEAHFGNLGDVQIQGGKYIKALPNYRNVDEYETFMFTLRAEGYRSNDSGWIALGDQNPITLDFALEAVEPVLVKIVNSDGDSVSGAKVYAFDPEQRTYFENNEQSNRMIPNEKKEKVSNKDGRVKIYPSTESSNLFVEAQEGYALLNQHTWTNDGLVIELHPWASTQLEMAFKDKPDVGAKVQLYRRRGLNTENQQGKMQFSYRGTVDVDGLLSFSRILPGSYHLSKNVSRKETGFSGKINVIPGEQTKHSIGGIGRPVTATYTLPTGMADRVNWERVGAQLSTKLPQFIMPEEAKDWSAEQAVEWRKKWVATEKGKAYLRAQEQAISYRTPVYQERKEIRIEDVQPGTYSLQIQFREKSDDSRNWNTPVLGTITQEVIVEPTEDGSYSDEAEDLGQLTIKQ